MRIALIAFCALAVLAEASAAHSQRRRISRNEERALRDLRAAQASYEEADYDTALRHLREAWAHFEAPVIRYNQGRVFEAMERWHDAADAYEIYLRLERPADETEARELEARTRELQSRCARGPCPILQLPTETPVEEAPSSLAPPLILAGSGAALMLGAAVSWGLAAGAESDRDQPATPLTEVLSLDEKSRRRARAGNALASVSGVVLVGAAVWLVLLLRNRGRQGDHEETDDRRITLSPTGVGVRF